MNRLIAVGFFVIVSLVVLGTGNQVEAWDATAILAIFGAVELVYYTVGVSRWSTTIGKRMIGAYVLRADGSKVGFVRAAARYVAYGPSSILLYGGFIMVAFRDDKRALHDLICDTVVVYRDA